MWTMALYYVRPWWCVSKECRTQDTGRRNQGRYDGLGAPSFPPPGCCSLPRAFLLTATEADPRFRIPWTLVPIRTRHAPFLGTGKSIRYPDCPDVPRYMTCSSYAHSKRGKSPHRRRYPCADRQVSLSAQQSRCTGYPPLRILLHAAETGACVHGHGRPKSKCQSPTFEPHRMPSIPFDPFTSHRPSD